MGIVNLTSGFQTVPCASGIPKSPSRTTFLIWVWYKLWREWDAQLLKRKGTILFNIHLPAYVLRFFCEPAFEERVQKLKRVSEKHWYMFKIIQVKNPISTVLRCVKMKLWILKFMAFLKLFWKQKDREVQYYHWLYHFRRQLFGTYYLLNIHSQNTHYLECYNHSAREWTLEDGTQQIPSWEEIYISYIFNYLTSSRHGPTPVLRREGNWLSVNCANDYVICGAVLQKKQN